MKASNKEQELLTKKEDLRIIHLEVDELESRSNMLVEACSQLSSNVLMSNDDVKKFGPNFVKDKLN